MSKIHKNKNEMKDRVLAQSVIGIEVDENSYPAYSHLARLSIAAPVDDFVRRNCSLTF